MQIKPKAGDPVTPLKGMLAKTLRNGGTFKVCTCKHVTAWSYDTQGMAKVCDRSVSCRHSVGTYIRKMVKNSWSFEQAFDVLMDPANAGARWAQSIEEPRQLLQSWYFQSAAQHVGLMPLPWGEQPKKRSRGFRPGWRGFAKILTFIEHNPMLGLDALRKAAAAALGWREGAVWSYLQEARRRGYVAVSKVDSPKRSRGRKPMVAEVVAWPAKPTRKVLRPERINPATGEVLPAIVGHYSKAQMAAVLHGVIDPDLSVFAGDLAYQRKMSARNQERLGKRVPPDQIPSDRSGGVARYAAERSAPNTTHLSPILQAHMNNFLVGA